MQLVRGVNLLCWVHFADPIILALKPTHTHSHTHTHTPTTMHIVEWWCYQDWCHCCWPQQTWWVKLRPSQEHTLGTIELSYNYDVVPQFLRLISWVIHALYPHPWGRHAMGSMTCTKLTSDFFFFFDVSDGIGGSRCIYIQSGAHLVGTFS